MGLDPTTTELVLLPCPFQSIAPVVSLLLPSITSFSSSPQILYISHLWTLPFHLTPSHPPPLSKTTRNPTEVQPVQYLQPSAPSQLFLILCWLSLTHPRLAYILTSLMTYDFSYLFLPPHPWCILEDWKRETVSWTIEPYIQIQWPFFHSFE